MLFFGTFIFIISLLQGEVPQSNVDAVLLQQVKDSYRQCLVIVDAVGKLDDDLNEIRRRSVDVATNASSKLKVCAEMVKSAEVFNRQHYAVTRSVLQVLQPSEISFLRNLLLKSAGKRMGKILYVASLDGDDSREFHRLCDGQGPTAVVVETKAGVIFGGYTDVSWDSNSGYKKTSTSFLFQIRPSMISFSKTGSNGRDMYNGLQYGPIFGNGNDLSIYSGATNNKKSYTYQTTYSMSSRYQLNNGVRHFQVKDYIVIKSV